MKLKETSLKGCYEIIPFTTSDRRGTFTKLFNKDIFEGNGLHGNWKEEYFTISRKNVIRGMHFQVPTFEHYKIVYCLHGEVHDVILDLRESSPTYGKTYSLNLSSENKKGIYISKGIAHGFLSLTEKSLLTYKVSSLYSKEHDSGILWNSFGYEWPIKYPITSDRDQNLMTLDDFKTPFDYE